MKNVICALVFLVISVSAQAQKFDSKVAGQIDAFITGQYETAGPGGAMLIAQNGNVVYRKAFGMASVELNVPLTPENSFEIGSITKQFTAICILMLQEQGKLSTSDDIHKYLPDFETGEYTVTIHHLLNHTSGIKSYTDMQEWAKTWRQDLTVDELIGTFNNQPFDFAPGEKWLYSNSGYILLGAIIEKVSGISYASFLQQAIFDPLKMANSTYGDRKKLITNRAEGYGKGAEGYTNAEYLGLNQAYAAGAIVSTVDDMWKWQQALVSNTLISEASFKMATTNYTLNNSKKTGYGYGFLLDELNGSPTIEHSGGIFGYTCNGIYLPNEKTYVIFLTNLSNVDPGTPSTRAAALAINKPVKDPQTIVLSEDQLKEYVAVYEYEDGLTRTITLEGNQLYSQIFGSSRYEIYPSAVDKFFIKDSFLRLTFQRDNMNQIGSVLSENRSDKRVAKRTNKTVEVKKEIALDVQTLERFVGKYALAPDFSINVFIQDAKLFGQATGQPPFQLYPKSELTFFLKVVDAEIDFIPSENGEITSLILHQGGQDMPGEKVK
jgi:CubicO group peptidase (beta-lactamase class C family)